MKRQNSLASSCQDSFVAVIPKDGIDLLSRIGDVGLMKSGAMERQKGCLPVEHHPTMNSDSIFQTYVYVEGN